MPSHTNDIAIFITAFSTAMVALLGATAAFITSYRNGSKLDTHTTMLKAQDDVLDHQNLDLQKISSQTNGGFEKQVKEIRLLKEDVARLMQELNTMKQPAKTS